MPHNIDRFPFSPVPSGSIRIAEAYITESAAEGLIAAQLGGIIGTAVFEAVNIGYPFTIPIKIGIAVSVIEGIGNAAYSYFETCSESKEVS